VTLSLHTFTTLKVDNALTGRQIFVRNTFFQGRDIDLSQRIPSLELRRFASHPHTTLLLWPAISRNLSLQSKGRTGRDDRNAFKKNIDPTTTSFSIHDRIPMDGNLTKMSSFISSPTKTKTSELDTLFGSPKDASLDKQSSAQEASPPSPEEVETWFGATPATQGTATTDENTTDLGRAPTKPTHRQKMTPLQAHKQRPGKSDLKGLPFEIPSEAENSVWRYEELIEAGKWSGDAKKDWEMVVDFETLAVDGKTKAGDKGGHVVDDGVREALEPVEQAQSQRGEKKVAKGFGVLMQEVKAARDAADTAMEVGDEKEKVHRVLPAMMVSSSGHQIGRGTSIIMPAPSQPLPASSARNTAPQHFSPDPKSALHSTTFSLSDLSKQITSKLQTAADTARRHITTKDYSALRTFTYDKKTHLRTAICTPLQQAAALLANLGPERALTAMDPKEVVALLETVGRLNRDLEYWVEVEGCGWLRREALEPARQVEAGLRGIGTGMGRGR
jgi:hypothetical protein